MTEYVKARCVMWLANRYQKRNVAQFDFSRLLQSSVKTFPDLGDSIETTGTQWLHAPTEVITIILQLCSIGETYIEKAL